MNKTTIKKEKEILKMLKTMSFTEIAKEIGVTKSTIFMFAKKRGIKSILKQGQCRKDVGIELLYFYEKHGLEKTCKKYGKTKERALQCVYNWRHKIGGRK